MFKTFRKIKFRSETLSQVIISLIIHEDVIMLLSTIKTHYTYQKGVQMSSLKQEESISWLKATLQVIN